MSPEFSKGKMSASASTAVSPLKNFHLKALHAPKKRRMGDVPHKYPGINTLVSLNSSKKKHQMSLNFAMDDMFCNDFSVDLFLEAFGGRNDKYSLNAYDGKIDVFFN